MNNKKPMHPGDNRNVIIFMVVSLLLYFAYDTFIMKPHAQALREAQAVQAEQAAIEVPQEALIAAAQGQTTLTIDEAISQSPARIDLANQHMQGSIDLSGTRLLDNIVLNDYFETLKHKEPVHVLTPKGTEFPRSVEYGWVAADEATKVPAASTKWQAKAGAKLTPTTPVTLFWNNGEGIKFERILTLDDNHLITIEQKVTNNSGKDVTLFPYGLISQKGLPDHFEGRFISHEGPIAYIDGELEEYSYKKMRKKSRVDFGGSKGWAGITDKYWLTTLIPPQGQDVKYRFHYVGTPPKKKQKDTGTYQVDFTGAALKLSSGQSGTVESKIFTGPKRVLLLKEYSKAEGIDRLDLAVDFGIFWFFTVPFFYGLHYLGLLVGNMGVAIILLTLIIRTIASPLTYSSYKSFAKMKKVMPEVQQLKAKYGETDKQRLQQEMLKLYQKEGVNPAAGCFPILLQIPIFFAFYKTLFVTIEVRHEPFFGWIHDLAAADPTSVFNLFGLIPWDPPSFLMIGVWPCLMLVAMQIQRRLNPPPSDQLQRDMATWFPFMMTFIMAQFASGLVIYWTVSAFFGVAQQAIIMRKMGVPIHLFGETAPEMQPDVIEGKAEIIEDEPAPKPTKPFKAKKSKKKK